MPGPFSAVTLTLVDLRACSRLRGLALAPQRVAPIARHPRLECWLDGTMRARPSVQRTIASYEMG